MPKTKKPFVDFRAIRARITMEQVLDHYQVLHTFKRNGNRLSGPCPIHNGSNPTQFRVELDRNIWKCFSECDDGGNVLDFIAKKDDTSIHDAALKACEWFSIPLVDAKAKTRTGGGEESGQPGLQAAPPENSPKPKADPEDNTPNRPLKFRLEKLQREHPYLIQERGLTPETIADFGLGYFTGDRGMMVGRIVIPIKNFKGDVVAYAGRWPGQPPGLDTPKYKLPAGFRKGLELFNIDRAIKEPPDEPLVIVEGFFDAIKLHQHGCRKVVALMGNSLSLAQEQLICQFSNSQSRIIVALDENNAGRSGREDIVCRLSRLCFVRVQEFKQSGTEPEHLTADEVKQLVGGVL